MPRSRCSSVETDVSDLISEEGSQSSSPLDVHSWVAHDSGQATKTCSSPSSSDTNTTDVLQLRLQVAASELSDRNARIRGLEATVRELQAGLAAAAGKDEGSQLSQAMLVQRIQQLEAALAATQQAEQDHAAQLARLEGRAAVAEGSLAATEQQLGKGLSELQAGHTAALASQQQQHSLELRAERQRHEAAATAAKADWEARLQELAAGKAAAEAATRREQQRVCELQAQLDKEGSKHEAVKELMRHSEALQCQVDRLQAAAQEERRRASKAAQAAEAAAQHERRLADAAAQEAQLKAQEAAREQDKLVRQARAKQQRAEAEVNSAKQAAAQLTGQVQQLEELRAKKDVQLDAAVQQVSLMQHELEALRQGLTGRQAAALESARGEYAAALASCHAELEATKARLREESLAVQRQGQALASILRILGVHAGEQAGAQAGGEGTSAAQAPCSTSESLGAGGDMKRVPGVAPDPAKVVAFVEAVSGSMLDVQQQWELEKAEAAAAQQAAAAVHEQLQDLLERERHESRGLAVDAAQMAVALQGMEEELEQARQQLHELDAAKAARAAADAALQACRDELAAASARAAAAGDEAVKWQGVAAAMEARAGQLSADAEAAKKEAQAARGEAEAKAGRMEELRSAMAAAVADRSSSAQGLSCALALAQEAIAAACKPALLHLQAAVAALGAEGAEGEPQVHALVAMLQAVAGLLRDLPPAEADLPGCVGALSSALAQLAGGYSAVTSMTQEREKVHQVLSSVNAQLQAAAASHRSRSQAAAAAGAAGPVPVGSLVAGQAVAMAPAGASASLSLVELLQQLTQTVVGLVEGLAVEKECLESQMLHASDEATQLRSQLQSMHAVLVSLQSHTSLEHREALLALEQARLQLASTQQENHALAQQAQQAKQAADASQASAARQWSAVRDDLSELVTQAEQAQLQADATCRRQQEEHEERLAAVERQASEAAAGCAAAEAEADRLQRELGEVRQELAAAEQLFAAREESLRDSLQASHADARQLEAKVVLLQKQLATHVRKGGISTAPAKKAAAASSAAAAHKRDSERLRAQVEGLQEQVRVLEAHMSKGVQQLRQARDVSEAAQRTIADAEGRASRAETLLRKIDERKAAAEVERRRASEAASRLEQQVLELQSRLEAAQHRERSAQADAERLRASCSKQQADARQLGGALSQLEVAEAALRDSQGTAGRLLQDCSTLQRENRRLGEQERQLTAQLQDAQAQVADAGHQVEDLQATLDSVITELEIARSLLDNQRHHELQQQLQALDGVGDNGGGALQRAVDGSPALPREQHNHNCRLVAYPMRVESLRLLPEADAGQQFMLDEAIGSSVLGARDTNAGRQSPGSRAAFKPGQQLTPGCSHLQAAYEPGPGAAGLPSPVTQLWTLRTPGTPAAEHTSAAAAAHDAATSRPASGGCSVTRPTTSASAGAAAAADVADIRRLVGAVESLQHQLALKSHQLRAVQKQLAASRPSTAAGGSRPGSAAAAGGSGGGHGAFVLQQKLAAAQQQVASLRALTDNLERQLGDAQQAQQAQQAVQAQLARIGRQLAALLSEEAGTGGGAALGSAQPSTSGDAVGVLRLQAYHLEQLAGRLEEDVHGSRRALAAAKQRGSTLTLQLASRSALVDALQAQLRTLAGQSSGSTSHADVQTEQLLRPPPSQAAAQDADAGPASAGAASAEALGSLDRIVALWRQACAAKDEQLQQLRSERDQAQEVLTCAQVELEALARTNEELAEQQHRSCSLAEELQQQLAEAEERAAAAQEAEQALAARCAELEVVVRDLQEATDADGGAVMEAREGQAAAAQQVQELEQQLQAATAQVRELQHAVQLEQLSRADAESIRQQAVTLKSELAATREQAAAAQRQATELQQRLHQQQDAAQAAATCSRSALAARLDAARRAEQQLLQHVQDLSAALAAAEAQGEEATHAATTKSAEASQLQERLSASEQQLRNALQTVDQQSGALSDLQAALRQQQRHQETTAAMHATQEQLARQLATTQQQLAAARQEAVAAQQQAEALRVQAGKAEAAAARAVAERRHLQATEQSVQEALQRYQQGLAVLSSTLRQLREAGPREGAGEDPVLASLHARTRTRASGGSTRAASSLPVGQLVDEILLQVHRRDCDIASLVAQVAHFEASLSSKARVAAEAETQQHEQQRSLARLKEQLQGCTQEAAALKRQLSDREAELRQLRLQAAANAGSGTRSAARRFSGMPSPAASGASSSKRHTPF